MNPKKIIALLWVAIVYFLQPLHAQSANNWAQSINAVDPQWPGYENQNITKSVRLPDGFVVCGTAYQAVFPSRNGDSTSRTNYGGPFVAKYDFSGNLIWLDYGIDSGYAGQSVWSTIKSVTADSIGNIYICGTMPPSSLFYYNNGQSSAHISARDTGFTQYNEGDFVAKLDGNGVPVWHGILDGLIPNFISNNANNGIVLSGEIEGYTCRYIKGSGVDTTLNSPSGFLQLQFIYWIDKDGNLVRSTITKESSVNYTGFTGMVTDKNGDVFIAGQYDQSITFLSASNIDSGTINQPPASTYGGKFYLVKYDSSGNYIWKVSDITQANPTLLMGNHPAAISVSPNGLLYVVVQKSYAGDTVVYFANSDSSVTSFYGGQSMLYKINENGHLDWEAPFWNNSSSSLIATDSTVTYAGSRFNSSAYPNGYTDTIYSVNNIAYRVVRSQDPNIFFTQYDTSGTLLNSGSIGRATGPVRYEFNGLINGNSPNNFILCGNFEGYNQVLYDQFFHDTLKFNGYDGFMINYTLNVGDTVGTPFFDPVVKLDSISKDTVCSGGYFMVYDSISGDFFNNNYFQIQLSDSNGHFNNPVQISGNYTAIPDSFFCPVPVNTISGNRYQVRIASSYYQRYSNSFPIVIRNSTPVSIALTVFPGTTIAAGQTATFAAHVTNGGDSTIYQWLINGAILNGEVNDTLSTNMLTDGDVVTVKVYAASTCISPDTASKSVIIHVLSGVGQYSTAENLVVYPNPNTDGDFLLSGIPGSINGAKVSVTNTVGQCIYSEHIDHRAFSGHHIILSSAVPSGTYFMKVEYGNASKNFRLTLIRN